MYWIATIKKLNLFIACLYGWIIGCLKTNKKFRYSNLNLSTNIFNIMQHCNSTHCAETARERITDEGEGREDTGGWKEDEAMSGMRIGLFSNCHCWEVCTSLYTRDLMQDGKRRNNLKRRRGERYRRTEQNVG